jgi:transposase
VRPPAYDPKLFLGVLLHGIALACAPPRQLERRCSGDIAFRVIVANQKPDHMTIARFRIRHETALAEFLVASLKLCAAAGMVHLGTVALDGTKLSPTPQTRPTAPSTSPSAASGNLRPVQAGLDAPS